MNERDYSGFIIAAYGFSLVFLAALSAWIALDARRQRRALAALEQTGLRRRSSAGGRA